ncbi:MAG: crotonase/enoyl-CoA hydratase family protein [Myxococcales bacterium]|nr:crotonase/enoyl-CoA hydratase family protein [Myxococcales bacterium]
MTTTLRDDVAVIRMDDGKANALSPAMLTELSAALDAARESAKAVVLAGRQGRFSAGFDLKIMTSGPDAARELVTTGCETVLRLYEHPQPVVVASTGHAIAGGAVLLLAGDLRLGAQGAYQTQLNEVAIGLPMPLFVSELARERLARERFVQATLLAQPMNPDQAAAVGFLDRVVEEESLLDEAVASAAKLAELPSVAFSVTKRSLREVLVNEVRATLSDDLDRVFAAFGKR